ncbi:MAG: hypothetical protein RMI94_11410 [Bryobacterales bacterium]|nr:hypothetical protein [Bryobacteraceae bacterium]MDW8131149.1 hypothetical protein [Bryobacterales bacterium]
MSEASDPAPITVLSRATAHGRSFRRALSASLSVAAPLLASLVLLVYPWTERWERNGLSTLVPAWSSGYLRGAVTGLGAVSLFLSLGSLARVRKKAPPA